MTAPRWSGAGSGAGGLRAPRRRPCPKGELQQTRGRHAVLGHVSPGPPPLASIKTLAALLADFACFGLALRRQHLL